MLFVGSLSMKKTIGYILFAIIYYICKPLPIIKNRVMCIMTHEEGDGNNVSLTIKALKNKSDNYTFSYITKSNTGAVKSLKGVKTLLTFFILKPYLLVRAEYVLMDNVFLPYAYCKRKKNTKVIQLWHGTGTIKKFGQDANTGRLKKLEKRANQNITHLIVNSQEMVELYRSAFGVEREHVYPIGLPKTDELIYRIKNMEQSHYNEDKKDIYEKYGIPKEGKLILYAPTFRDNELHNPKVLELLQELQAAIPESYYLGLRLHPFIAKSCPDLNLTNRILQLSFETDLNKLIMASDLLITDYSSIIFEYCLTERPMLFYAYDLQEFSNSGRGFYKNYHDFVPGLVLQSAKDIGTVLCKGDLKQTWVIEFKERNYPSLDGKATERLIQLVFG